MDYAVPPYKDSLSYHIISACQRRPEKKTTCHPACCCEATIQGKELKRKRALLVFFPTARVRTLIFLGIFITMVTLYAFILIGLWFLLQFFDGVIALSDRTQQAMGGVAYFAHVGGFLAGLIIALILRPFLGKPAPRTTSYPRWPNYPGSSW